ncbi:molybdopterin-dependent oxidoreductase [Eggerthella sp. YY7918]|uniref:molybdopterin-dependent oxidoreductase n=1 Tax=Eggerthella sp. (strain YY7918) TaxID=502558 RepID=UPI0002171084|nr:molybdopterin-dependent oxidoreductase [Eggerthella sp. YY7918]BAK43433.1 anaerobic dehydrogenase [Eggerthella sp. YY7918]
MIDRRGFLKAVGATAALGAVSGATCLHGASSAFAENDEGAAASRQEIKGYCRMCMRDGCNYIATMENGVVTSIEGNPDAEGNRGTMCGRGKGAIMHYYNPYRIKTPMKRTNPEKGFDVDPGWVEITWDEALSTAAEKFKEIHDKDPRELVFIRGFAIYDTINADNIGGRFSKVFGTPNEIESNGSLCAVHYATCMVTSDMPVTISDQKYAKYVVSIGRSAGANLGSANGSCRNIADAVEQNAFRHIVVDPRCSMEASQGEWVPILPGQDLPFLFGLINVMLFENGGYDVAFLKQQTNAPYLLMEDGFYLRNGEGKPMIWDVSDNTAKTFDDAGLIDPAIEGEFTVEGKTVRPSFEWVRDSMKEYTPEWAEELCSIPADKIREIANDLISYASIGSTISIDGHEFAYRPAALIPNRGVLNHENGSQIDLAVKIVNELLGNMDVPGGSVGASRGKRSITVSADGVVEPFFEAALGKPFVYPPDHFDMKEFYPHRHSTATTAFKVISEGTDKYGMEITPKAFFCCGGNPINDVSMPDTVAAAFKAVPFVFSFAYHMDEVAMFSDIIIPEDCMLEMESMHAYKGNIENIGFDNMIVNMHQYRNPMPRLYNTRNANDVFLELFDRMGMTSKINDDLNKKAPITGQPLADEYALDRNTLYTIGDIYDRTMKTAHGQSMGLDYFKEHGFIDLSENTPECEAYADYFWHGKVRYQFYFHTQKESGASLLPKIKAVPHDFMNISMEDLERYYQGTLFWCETNVFKSNDEYDLFAFNYKIPQGILRIGFLDQNPWVGDWNERFNPFYNSITMHTSAAEKRGLKEGDIVVVESAYGETKGKLHVTELLHPQAIGIPGATGRKVKTLGAHLAERVHWNCLTEGLPGSMSPVTGAVENTVRVKVYKAEER